MQEHHRESVPTAASGDACRITLFLFTVFLLIALHFLKWYNLCNINDLRREVQEESDYQVNKIKILFT